MAEGGSDEIVEKIVCGICTENYRQPKLLPCYHSFCLNCLENYATRNLQKNKFDCPLCETAIESPEGGVKDFPRNYYIESKLKNSDDEKSDCDLCGPEVNAVNHCTECDENYCERCTDTHMKMKLCRNHTLISLNQLGLNRIGPVKKRIFCEKHPNDEVRVVCKDCDKLLCIICKLTDHEKHNSKDITDEAEIAKGQLRKQINVAEQSISRLEKLLDRLKMSKHESCSRRKSHLAQAQDFKRKIISTLESKVNELEQFLTRRFDNMESAIGKQSSNVERTIASLSNIVQYVNDLTRVSDNVTLLATSQNVKTRMTECIRKADVCDIKLKIYTEQTKQILQRSDFYTNDTLGELAGITFIKENIKNVSKIHSCSLDIGFIIVSSNNVCSICVFQTRCAVSFADCEQTAITYIPTGVFKILHANGKALSCLELDSVYYSDIKTKEVKVWNKTPDTVVKLYKSDLNPHA